MENDPSLDPKFLGQISQDFVKLSDNLKEAAYQMIVREISKFPVFPTSKVDLPIGKLIFDKGFTDNVWKYHISFMEEFVARGIVDEPDIFKANFKDPDEFCCLFVVDPEFTHFVFIPYPVD